MVKDSGVEITYDEEGSKRLNEAWKAIRTTEALQADLEMRAAEEPDERLRRLVVAREQLTLAEFIDRPFGAQAALWAYQAIDNAIHAALLAAKQNVSRNHAEKLKSFASKFNQAIPADLFRRMEEAYELWTELRYERTSVPSELGHRAVDTAYAVVSECFEIVANATGIGEEALENQLREIEDRIGAPTPVHSESAGEQVELAALGFDSRAIFLGQEGPCCAAESLGSGYLRGYSS